MEAWFWPDLIILGGGVMEQAQLFPLVRAEVQRLLNGYVQMPAILADIDRYIVPPEFQADYAEKVLYMPRCYQPNDRRRVIGPAISRHGWVQSWPEL